VKKTIVAIVICMLFSFTNIALAQYSLPDGDGKDIINNKCKTCHGLGFIVEGDYTKSQWAKMIKDMKSMGLQLTEDEEKKALAYLTKHFGKPDAKGAGSAAKTPSKKSVKSTLVTKMSPGEIAYNKNCAYCHRPTGNGIDGAFPPLAGNRIITKDKAYNIMVMLYGHKGGLCVNEMKYDNTMPSWSHLDDNEIAYIINYYLTSWGNEKNLAQGLTPVTASDIVEQRKVKKTAQEVAGYRKEIAQ
jgi:mono/diheme cytochrome c family protein